MTIKKTKESGNGSPIRALINFSSSEYGRLLSEISDLLEGARRTAARSVNSILTATYWNIGRRIVEFEQQGKVRADYGKQLLVKLANDLSTKYGRGFSERNLRQMRTFYVGWGIWQTPSAKLEARVISPSVSVKITGGKRQTVSAELHVVQPENRVSPEAVIDLSPAFPLPWSHYVRLMAVANPAVRTFYEAEAIRGGWSVRQLDRQIGTQFYERSLVSKHRDEFLARGRRPQTEDRVSVEEEIRDPYLLEFLNLRDEYSEAGLEEAFIRHLEWFLLEMGSGFTFVARQKRIRVGDSWYRIDLLLYHRGLRCLIVIDLKRGPFTHADAGQMNLYLNYVKEHLMMPGESDPVGIILCGDKDEAVVKYATGGIRAKVFASKYLTVLPDEEALRQEILKTRRLLEIRQKEGRHNG